MLYGDVPSELYWNLTEPILPTLRGMSGWMTPKSAWIA